MTRVLAICLDGYEESVSRQLIASGQLPSLARLERESRRFWLDHGSALRTGLAGEHVATGLSPEAAARWAAVHFDPRRYTVAQRGTKLPPFSAKLRSRVVVFDPPYFDLAKAPNTQGVVAWGAHDPGVAARSRPSGVLGEIARRFGEYPANGWIYGTPWNAKDRAREMGARLADGVSMRAEVAKWLLAERLPDWDLALVTVSEAHSAIEGLWHGIDSAHPLHGCDSAQVAGDAVRTVYCRIDSLIGELESAFPDATLAVFSMHGMGPNASDAGSMLLLPEFLYRRAFGHAYFDRVGEASAVLMGRPEMDPADDWNRWVAAGFSRHSANGTSSPSWLKRLTRRLAHNGLVRQLTGQTSAASSLDWMPATRYRSFWSRMPAFALPSFYDGRVRVNLIGRERSGVVPAADYAAFCEDLVADLQACVDPVTGEPVVAEVEWPARENAQSLGATQADLIVLWRGAPLGLRHDRHGQIGPIPYRRTGGHTGARGFAFVRGANIHTGDGGVRSAYDVVPTLIDLLGERSKPELTGASLLLATNDAR